MHVSQNTQGQPHDLKDGEDDVLLKVWVVVPFDSISEVISEYEENVTDDGEDDGVDEEVGSVVLSVVVVRI